MATNDHPLAACRIAILATDGFEESELFSPREAVQAQGALVDILAPARGVIQGSRHQSSGRAIVVDKTLSNAQANDYDALILPGGTTNADALRTVPEAQTFVRHFFDRQRPVAAICHAPWLLINAGVVKGRTLTSYPSLRHDLENAGAKWLDETVVVDGNLVTSRTPHDLPAFNTHLIEVFARSAPLAHVSVSH